ncbi:MAG: UDP-N-acetylmuramoyl-L-alanyl-D-glutamate--2,6-diaminopimelate ligase [Planctomycetes bacterium]|nr:UDP-N-acetylmuramoyl-L-alanyl-D-glutamate--2,6-diaminopimelate ligase [Planctomycetota bacterium]NOG55105.1 UDP-N-acetylmuramoyl-L-alanyl-D-glutamate--2,6-diaminopimelate ligase [Planctomycetota bacterium]
MAASSPTHPDTSRNDRASFCKTVSHLIVGTPVRLRTGHPDTLIHDVIEDSRAVGAGSLFVARRGGDADGRSFVPQAIECGAVAILTDDEQLNLPGGHSEVCVLHAQPDLFAQATADVAERFFGHPSSRLTLIGITGTNGKTTIAHLLQQMLDHAGLIGTVCIHDGVQTARSVLTTPFAIDLSRTLARMVANQCRFCAMEVSSHALDQGRVAGLRFHAGVFTNLTGDHLDYHGDMEHYAAAKARLFAALPPSGVAVVNVSDPASSTMLAECRARTVLACRLADGSPALRLEMPAEATVYECTAQVCTADPTGCDIRLHGPWDQTEPIETRLPLIGAHNVINALQAAAIAWFYHVEPSIIRERLASCTATPGRLERVACRRDDLPFTVYVDFAHTDDALNTVLRSVRSVMGANGGSDGSQRLVVLFGCGGDRDRTKRPRMAAAACQWADVVWVTSDNPRTEDPQAIVNDVCTGIPEGSTGPTVHVEVDRTSAIKQCIAAAQPGDVIVIAGKGHEDYQIIGKTKYPFSDHDIAHQAMMERP